uniref:Uncharacterized protein n=1 Tax=Anguilla anguilla TaxID=7936 RepID=A0A0E9PBH6_ANGAN
MALSATWIDKYPVHGKTMALSFVGLCDGLSVCASGFCAENWMLSRTATQAATSFSLDRPHEVMATVM